MRSRLAGWVLLACSGVLSPVHAQQSGDDTVFILSETMTGDTEGALLEAVGHVEITRGNFVLLADRARYDTASKVISAFGNVQLRGLGALVIGAQQVQTTGGLERVFVREVSLSFGRGQLKARRAVATDRGGIVLERVSATGCPDCGENGWPFWSVSALRAERDPDTRRVTFAHSILRVNGIPLAYIPGISFPSPEVPRASGFLLPEFGNSRVGAAVTLPYHLVLSRNQDATFAARLSGLTDPTSTLEYRGVFDTARIFMGGSATYDSTPEKDAVTNENRYWSGHVSGSATVDLGRSWRMGAVIERQTDNSYDLRNDISLTRSSIDRPYQNGPRNLSSHLYLMGGDANFEIEASAFAFQDISAATTNQAQPGVIPYVRARRRFANPTLGVAEIDVFGFAASQEADGEDHAFGSARLSWERQIGFGPGFVLTPHALGRIDRAWQGDGETTYSSGRIGGSLAWPLALKGRFGALIEPRAWISAEAKSGEIPNRPYWAEEVTRNGFSDPTHAVGLTPPVAFAGVAGKANLKGVLLSLNAGRRWLVDGSQDTIFSMRLSKGAQFGTARVIMDNALTVREADIGIAFVSGDLTGRLTYFVSRTEGREGGRLRLSYSLDDNWSAIYIRESNIAQSFDISQSSEVVFDGACTRFALWLRHSGIAFDSIGPDTTLGFNLVFKIPS